jgi:hypothetical protein
MTTNYQDDLGASPGDGSEASPGAKERAQQTASTAADQTKHVAGVAQEEVTKVASEAGDQVRGLLDEATSQVDEQSRHQKSKLAETLRSFGEDLDGMSRQQEGSGQAGQLVRQVADQAKSWASHLDDREPQELLEDVRRYARRRPGTFLLGALAAGVVVGRFARGAKDAHSADAAPGTGTGAGTATSAARPSASPDPLAPRTVGSVTPTPVTATPAGADLGHAPEPRESLGAPGAGRDALVDPLDPSEPLPGGPTSGGGPA